MHHDPTSSQSQNSDWSALHRNFSTYLEEIDIEEAHPPPAGEYHGGVAVRMNHKGFIVHRACTQYTAHTGVECGNRAGKGGNDNGIYLLVVHHREAAAPNVLGRRGRARCDIDVGQEWILLIRHEELLRARFCGDRYGSHAGLQ